MINPIPIFRKNNILTIGSAMITAVLYKKPVAPIALPKAFLRLTALPTGKVSKLFIISSNTTKCPLTEKKVTTKIKRKSD